MAGTWPTASSKVTRSVISSPPARRLLRPAAPVPGESLRGLVADTCARNQIPNTWGMLQYFGLKHRNRVDISESDEIDTAALAATLAISETELNARRYPSLGRSHRSFYGLQLNAGRIENRTRRFSPAAIAAGHLHHPAVHELRDLPFSPVGWDILQDMCPCEIEGVRQGWTRVNGTARCDSCGGRLDRLHPILVPDSCRSSLSLLVGLIDPDDAGRVAALKSLPESIRLADRNLLFDITVAIGKCAENDNDKSPLRQTEALAEACEALLAWPHGLARVRRGSHVSASKWERTRRNYLVLDSVAGTASSGRDDSRGQASEAKTTAPLRATYQPSGQCGRVQQPYISAMAAARLVGVDEQALKQAWDDRLLTQHSWAQGSDRVRAFDADEVIALSPRLRRAKARARSAHLLGISIFGIEQLAAFGIFRPAAPDADRSQWDVHQAEALRLTDRLQNGAVERVERPNSLVEAVRHISGRPKPWGAIIRSLANAEIPYVYTENERVPLVKRIIISGESLALIQSMTFDRRAYADEVFEARWMQRDALECLNGDANAPRLLENLHSSGTRPRWYLADEIETLARQGVTTSDLARRAKLSVSKSYRVLEGLNIAQVAPGLWDRQAAERAVLS